MGKEKYFGTLKKMRDSLDLWVINKLKNSEAEFIYDYEIDSLICFNTNKNRAISCIHLFGNQFNSTSDNLIWYYGENINDNWYFFKGANLVLPRSMFKDHPTNQPLSYQQLHQIALKEVYGGYLNDKREINEDWFIYHFEGPGYGDFNDQTSTLKFLNRTEKFTNKREFFEAIHLQSVRNNWYGVNKDSIKQLPSKTNLP